MKVNAIKCPKCKCIIFSRARHDFRRCKCKSVYIDGGFDYVRMGCKEKLYNKVKVVQLNVKQTKLELYNDYNNYVDKYGLIEPKKGKKK